MEAAVVRSPARQSGFSLIEMVLVLAIVGILVSVALPRVSTTLLQEATRRASVQVATQIEYAFASAARTNAPVTLQYDSASGVLTVARRSGAPLRQMLLKQGSAFALTRVTFSPSVPVVVFPDGVASSSMSAALGYPGYARTVTASRTGLVTVK
jgi:prepilin-type N-terminal cleavage/methylation domain-containing protein